MKFGMAAASAVRNFAPEPPAAFFSDNWDTANASNWDTLKWPGQRGGSVAVSSNRGVLSVGSRPIALSSRCVRDFEELVKVQYTTLSGQYLEIGWRVNSYTLTGTPADGYVFQIDQGTTAHLYRINTYTQVGATVSTPELTGGGTFWIRVRAVGSSHKIRWWQDGATEPSTWQMDYTDATYTEGALMLGNYGSGTVSFDDLMVTQISAEDPAVGSIRAPIQADHAGGALITAPSFAGADLTICGWFQVQTTGAAHTLFGMDNAGANFFIVGSNPSDFLRLDMPTGGFVTTTALTVDTWYFLALTRTAAGCELYWCHEGDPTLTKQTTATAPALTGSLNFLRTGYGTTNRGVAAALKVWTAQLSQSELTTEMANYHPVRVSSLWGSWSMEDGIDSTDESGNGHTLVWENSLVSGPAAPAA